MQRGTSNFYRVPFNLYGSSQIPTQPESFLKVRVVRRLERCPLLTHVAQGIELVIQDFGEAMGVGIFRLSIK